MSERDNINWDDQNQWRNEGPHLYRKSDDAYMGTCADEKIAPAIVEIHNKRSEVDDDSPSASEIVEVLKTEKPRLLKELKDLSGQFTADFRLNGGDNLEGLHKRAMEIDRALSLIARLEGA